MLKRLLSATVLAAVLVATGLASSGCTKEPDVVVERHEDINTERTVGQPKTVID